MTMELSKASLPDWGPYKIWRIPDPAPWWKLIEKLDQKQLTQIATIQLDFQIEVAQLEVKQLQAMKSVLR